MAISNTDIVNRALQTIGTRTTVTDGELAANSTNEAIQANLVLTAYRDQLLRMAPWNCGLNYENLVYITSTAGTPENSSPPTSVWQKGQPAPPWAYEYQYPADCLRACFLLPTSQTGVVVGVPITNAATGAAPAFWSGQPVKFKVALDQFFVASTPVTIVAAGTGYAIGDIVSLAQAPQGSPPFGAVGQYKVDTIDGSGGILSLHPINQFSQATATTTGSYFASHAGTSFGVTTNGSGINAILQPSWSSAAADQRVILTNQQAATMAYVKQVTDPNVMDQLFVEAWINILGAKLCMALTGDRQHANTLVELANRQIMEARQVDGNEALTVNDVTPDWLRIRGIAWSEYYSGPWSGFDWGNMWQTF